MERNVAIFLLSFPPPLLSSSSLSLHNVLDVVVGMKNNKKRKRSLVRKYKKEV